MSFHLPQVSQEKRGNRERLAENKKAGGNGRQSGPIGN